MNLLFVTCLETGLAGGIYQSQVKRLLCVVSKQGRNHLRLTLLTILPLISLNRRGVRFLPITMKQQLAQLRKDLAKSGVDLRVAFVPHLNIRPTVYQNALSTLCLMALLLPVLAYHQLRYRYDLIHCRSYISCLGALLMRRLFGKIRVVFDARGLYPEEGLVQGKWGAGSLSYKFWKTLEKRMFKWSDKVVCLSDQFADYVSEIEPKAKTEIIFASIESARFAYDSVERDRRRRDLDFGESLVFIYCGGLGSWHDPVLLCRLFKAIMDGIPNAKLLVLSDYRKDKLRAICSSLEISHEKVFVKKCTPKEVPDFLMTADWALVPLQEIPPDAKHVELIARTMVGLKVGEYLAAGLPLIINRHIEGIKSLMGEHDIGTYFDVKQLGNLAQHLRHRKSGEMRPACQGVAQKHFDISNAAKAYIDLYRNIDSEQ